MLRRFSVWTAIWLAVAFATRAAGGEAETRGVVTALQAGPGGNLILITGGGETPLPSWQVWRVPTGPEGLQLEGASLLGELPLIHGASGAPRACIHEGTIYCIYATASDNLTDLRFAAFPLAGAPASAPRPPKTIILEQPPGSRSDVWIGGLIPVCIFVDGTGNLCLVVAYEGGRLFLSRSADRGETWSRAIRLPADSPLPRLCSFFDSNDRLEAYLHSIGSAPKTATPASRWPLALGTGLGGLALGFALAALYFRRRRAA